MKPRIEALTAVVGVQLVHLQPHEDDRGYFLETFRKEWFPQRLWRQVQTNRSESRAGVLRGLHFHQHQVDYWYVTRGRLRVGLADLRPESPTFRAATTLEMSGETPLGLFIPTRVAHGFVALTDVTLTYVVDNYFDGADENGVAWNDPELAVPWGVDEPVVSARDAANPRFRELLPLTPLPESGQ